jgi:hypothetical protein
MALGLVGAAVVSFAGALLVIRFMPARDETPQLRVAPPQATPAAASDSHRAAA